MKSSLFTNVKKSWLVFTVTWRKECERKKRRIRWRDKRKGHTAKTFPAKLVVQFTDCKNCWVLTLALPMTCQCQPNLLHFNFSFNNGYCVQRRCTKHYVKMVWLQQWTPCSWCGFSLQRWVRNKKLKNKIKYSNLLSLRSIKKNTPF